METLFTSGLGSALGENPTKCTLKDIWSSTDPHDRQRERGGCGKIERERERKKNTEGENEMSE